MIIEPTQLNAIRNDHPRASIGYTSGVFDLFHNGHKNYISECKKRCDILIVGVDSNRLARQRKGRTRPIQDVSQRMNNVDLHAHYVFTKDAPSEIYTSGFHPNFYFFSKDNLITREKHQKLSAHPNFENTIFIPYTESVSTSKILCERLPGNR